MKLLQELLQVNEEDEFKKAKAPSYSTKVKVKAGDKKLGKNDTPAKLKKNIKVLGGAKASADAAGKTDKGTLTTKKIEK